MTTIKAGMNAVNDLEQSTRHGAHIGCNVTLPTSRCRGKEIIHHHDDDEDYDDD